MIFPEYLKDNDTIGITACSYGVLNKINKYEQSISHFKKHFNIIETNNVRLNDSDKLTKWLELKSLIENKDVKLISIAAGGNYLYEMLDYVDYNLIKNNIKWFSGSSDPTSLLFTITTKLDIATIYSPCNMSGYSMTTLHDSLNNYFKIIKGEKIVQTMYDKYELNDDDSLDGYNLDTDNEWININGDVNISGLLIGGCIESIKDIIGTKYDYVNSFLDRHKDENIIWYFDVFSMSSEELSLTLRQFNNAGWFKNTKAILIGKVKYVPKYNEETYEDAIKRAIDNIPIVYQFDIGHVKPSFTLINGSYVEVVSNNKDKYIKIKED